MHHVDHELLKLPIGRAWQLLIAARQHILCWAAQEMVLLLLLLLLLFFLRPLLLLLCWDIITVVPCWH
jgi:hypothetical protein